MNLFHSISCRVRALMGMPPAWIHQEILGVRVRVRDGFRHVTDYDDAWNFALMRESTVFADVGCNVGFFALLAGLENPNRRVLAIDPNPAALAQAAENLFMNGISQQVDFVLAFASDHEDEMIDFFTIGTGAAGSKYSLNAKTAARLHKFFKVKTVSLDQIAERAGVNPDFVKIDVEGAEGEVLTGAKKIASKGLTRFIVEMHSVPGVPMVKNAEQVLEWCRGLNYSAYYLKHHCLLDRSELVADRGRCHLMLQPQGWAYPEYLRGIAQGDALEKSFKKLRSR